MKITTNNFETIVAPEILKRGEKYYKQGHVSDLEEIDDNFWSALVTGTETYTVKIKLDDNEVTELLCDCPYDLGPICKHEVAMLYAIKKHFNGEKLPNKKTAKTAGKNRKTVADKIDDILKNASLDELVNIVRDFALENIEFRNILLANFINEDDSNSTKSLYRRIIKESLRDGMDRHGFIDYWSGRKATRGINELLSKADQLLDNKKPEQASLIYQTAIEEVVPALQFADDSNGDFGDVIRWSFEKLAECASLTKNESTRKNLLTYCLSESTSKRYDGWSDWQWEFIQIASGLINKDETELVFLKINELTKSAQDKSYSRYDNEQGVKIKLEIINRFMGEKESANFINENLEYTPIRKAAIEAAVADNNLGLAKKLANDGIILDTKREWPGLVIDWIERLYKIANNELNIIDIRKYATRLFAEGRGFEYYDKLKSTYSKEEWKKEVDVLLKNLKGTRFGNYSNYGEIFIREEKWGDLLSLVKEHPSMQTIETYKKYLEKYFPAELIDIYEQAIKKMLLQTTGRGVYQDACKMLRRMKKLGAPEKVQSLIAEFKETYKNRKALLEELEMV